MVTTNSIDFRAIDLQNSSERGRLELYGKMLSAYQQVLGVIGPRLRYITLADGVDENGRGIRFVVISKKDNGWVVMDRDGKLRFRANRSAIWGECRPIDWKTLHFFALLTDMSNVLKNAEDKKEADRRSIAECRERIDGLLTTFKF